MRAPGSQARAVAGAGELVEGERARLAHNDALEEVHRASREDAERRAAEAEAEDQAEGSRSHRD